MKKIVAGFLSLISIGIMLFVVKDKLIEEKKQSFVVQEETDFYVLSTQKRFIHSYFLKMTSKNISEVVWIYQRLSQQGFQKEDYNPIIYYFQQVIF